MIGIDWGTASPADVARFCDTVRLINVWAEYQLDPGHPVIPYDDYALIALVAQLIPPYVEVSGRGTGFDHLRTGGAAATLAQAVTVDPEKCFEAGQVVAEYCDKVIEMMTAVKKLLVDGAGQALGAGF